MDDFSGSVTTPFISHEYTFEPQGVKQTHKYNMKSNTVAIKRNINEKTSVYGSIYVTSCFSLYFIIYRF